MLLARLEEIIVGQIFTADDALEDWNDIVPDDVEELKQAFESDNTMEESMAELIRGKVAGVLNSREIAIM